MAEEIVPTNQRIRQRRNYVALLPPARCIVIIRCDLLHLTFTEVMAIPKALVSKFLRKAEIKRWIKTIESSNVPFEY